MATDKDNIAEAIYKSVKSVSNESLLSASILGDNLTLTLKPDQTGEATVSVNFDSNGKNCHKGFESDGERKSSLFR